MAKSRGVSDLRLDFLENSLFFLVAIVAIPFGSKPTFIALLYSGLIYLLMAIFWRRLAVNVPEYGSHLKTLGALFLYLLIQSVIFSKDFYASSTELLKYGSYFCLFLLIQFCREKALFRLLFAIVIVGAFQVIYGFMELLSGQEKVLWIVKEAHTGYLTGTFLNRNHLAAYLNLGIAILLGSVVHAYKYGKKKELLIASILLLVMFIGVIKTGSRLGWFCSLVVIILSVISLGNRILTVFCAIYFGVFALNKGPLVQRLLNQQESFYLFDSERWIAWRAGWTMAKDYLWQGVGLGVFGKIFPKYQPAELTMQWLHLHQGYLELLIEVGVLGIALVFISGGLFLIASLTRIKRSNRYYPFEMGIILAILASLIHGFGDFIFAVPAIAVTLFTMISILYRFQHDAN